MYGEYEYTWFEVADPENNGEGNGTDEILLTFPSPGTYEVSFIPTGENPLNQIQFNGNYEYSENDAYKLLEVKQWGDVEWSSFEKAFSGTENLSITATDIPNLSNVTNMSKAFRYSGISQVPNMNDWDVSQVENMSSLFEKAEEFNTDITNWNVGQVTNMSNMFAEASIFQQQIGVWDVSNVTDMSYMFYDYDMLAKPYSLHNTSENDDYWGFNQPINDWDVSNVTNMAGMFSGAFSFNQPLDQWDVSNVTNMAGMFAGSPFNQDINSWNVSNVESMGSMFAYAYFNQDISAWDVSNVFNFEFMFGEAYSFNQSLAEWTFKDNASGMAMFWETNNLSRENLSLSIQGWAANPEMGTNFGFDATTKYSHEISDAVDYLINSLNWGIGTSEGDCTLDIPENQWVEFKLYPNPAQDQLYISGIKGNEKLEIFDIQGRILKQSNELTDGKSIDISDLSTGIYWVRLSAQGETTIKKLIKE